MDEHVVYSTNCSLYKDNDCKSALHYAMDAGKFANTFMDLFI